MTGAYLHWKEIMRVSVINYILSFACTWTMSPCFVHMIMFRKCIYISSSPLVMLSVLTSAQDVEKNSLREDLGCDAFRCDSSRTLLLHMPANWCSFWHQEKTMELTHDLFSDPCALTHIVAWLSSDFMPSSIWNLRLTERFFCLISLIWEIALA